MRSHKSGDNTVMQLMDMMQESHVTQNCRIGVLFELHGQDNVPFTTRDIENRKAANVRKEKVDNIKKLLNFFNQCTLQNPKFYWDTKLDEHGVTKNLFWSHASSQAEYSDFGDAVTFDRAYQTNIYEMSLAMFVDQQTALHRFASRMLDVIVDRKEKEATETQACSTAADVDEEIFTCECKQWEHTGLF
uniref:Uncharacterized protein n=1 Tax=Oryza brachyantha TaxID=4533 RepID=J3KVF6_ORYBR